MTLPMELPRCHVEAVFATGVPVEERDTKGGEMSAAVMAIRPSRRAASICHPIFPNPLVCKGIKWSRHKYTSQKIELLF